MNYTARKPITDELLETVEGMILEGKTHAEIAPLINRTLCSTRMVIARHTKGTNRILHEAGK